MKLLMYSLLGICLSGCGGLDVGTDFGGPKLSERSMEAATSAEFFLAYQNHRQLGIYQYDAQSHQGKAIDVVLSVENEQTYHLYLYNDAGEQLESRYSFNSGSDQSHSVLIENTSSLFVVVYSPQNKLNSSYQLALTLPETVSEMEPNNTFQDAQGFFGDNILILGTLPYFTGNDANDLYRFSVLDGELINIELNAVLEEPGVIELSLYTDTDLINPVGSISVVDDTSGFTQYEVGTGVKLLFVKVTSSMTEASYNLAIKVANQD